MHPLSTKGYPFFTIGFPSTFTDNLTDLGVSILGPKSLALWHFATQASTLRHQSKGKPFRWPWRVMIWWELQPLAAESPWPDFGWVLDSNL